MPITTPTHYAILALILLAGWLFGLASHSGGRKWKARYEKERADHVAYRADADGRIRDYDRRDFDAKARVRALEADLATERNRQPYVPEAAQTPTQKPVYISEREKGTGPRVDRQRGWFDFGS